MSDWLIPSNPDFDRSELPCSICCLEVETYKNIVVMDPCGHICCNKCFDSLKSKCHVCRESPIRKMDIEKHTTKLILKGSYSEILGYCRFCDPEQKSRKNYFVLLFHECKNRPKPCKYECGKLLYQGESHDCPNEPKFCVVCEIWLPEVSYISHVSECTEKHATCKFCNRYISKIWLETHENDTCPDRNWVCSCDKNFVDYHEFSFHIKNDCIFRLINCEFCDLEFLAIDSESHKSECKNVYKCKYCNIYVAKIDNLGKIQNHLAVECPKTDVCVNCYQSYPMDDLPIFKPGNAHICAEKLIPCPTGCGDFFLRKKLPEHKCTELEAVDCKNGCGLKLVKSQIDLHQPVCEKAPKTCLGCHRSYKPDLFADHQKICSGLDTCLNCWEIHAGKYQILRYNEYHICKFRIVTCSICKKKMQEYKLKEHKEVCKPVEMKTCPLCECEFTAADLNTHLYDHVKPTSITKCGYCLSFVNVDDFDRHRKICYARIPEQPRKKTEEKHRCGEVFTLTVSHNSSIVRGVRFKPCLKMNGEPLNKKTFSPRCYCADPVQSVCSDAIKKFAVFHKKNCAYKPKK